MCIFREEKACSTSLSQVNSFLFKLWKNKGFYLSIWKESVRGLLSSRLGVAPLACYKGISSPLLPWACLGWPRFLFDPPEIRGTSYPSFWIHTSSDSMSCETVSMFRGFPLSLRDDLPDFAFDDHVINIHFNIPTHMVAEDIVHYLLVCSPYIFKSK